MTDEQIAKVAHEANRAYCEVLGDTSQKPWEQAADWQRASAIRGVKFRLENPYAGPEAQHEAWRSDKLADGWVYGETKDTEKKQHPCMMPFHELPERQRVKDVLFAAVVDALRTLPQD